MNFMALAWTQWPRKHTLTHVMNIKRWNATTHHFMSANQSQKRACFSSLNYLRGGDGGGGRDNGPPHLSMCSMKNKTSEMANGTRMPPTLLFANMNRVNSEHTFNAGIQSTVAHTNAYINLKWDREIGRKKEWERIARTHIHTDSQTKYQTHTAHKN